MFAVTKFLVENSDRRHHSVHPQCQIVVVANCKCPAPAQLIVSFLPRSQHSAISDIIWHSHTFCELVIPDGPRRLWCTQRERCVVWCERTAFYRLTDILGWRKWPQTEARGHLTPENVKTGFGSITTLRSAQKKNQNHSHQTHVALSKCTQMRLRLHGPRSGPARPPPAGETYSASPDSLAGITGGALWRGREGTVRWRGKREGESWKKERTGG